jgi:hypothetical protein
MRGRRLRQEEDDKSKMTANMMEKQWELTKPGEEGEAIRQHEDTASKIRYIKPDYHYHYHYPQHACAGRVNGLRHHLCREGADWTLSRQSWQVWNKDIAFNYVEGEQTGH